MENKKSFFELLNAKSALIVGVVGGVLSLGTIGFIVLMVMTMQGTLKLGAGLPAAVTPTVLSDGGAVTAPPPNVPKTKRPKVELFVMSYCPFGLQMQKALAPAWELLGKKADIDVKFVSYAMHDLKEVEENTRQYCVQKEQSDKYIAYLKCFTASGDSASCVQSTGVNKSKMDKCFSATDKQFGVMAQYNDKSAWLSGQFPIYPVHKDLNDKYGVQGSPTLVINGVQADAARTPEAVKQAICAGFENPPSECGQQLSALSYQAGFGTQQQAAGGAAAAPGCGT
ncbi:MAG: hypothetical protein EXS55_03215 [Candidatus Magasanikbacteria bacterium]|nr:hypothetical protein [Candidatus Magasanikbacteria bacterium]